MIKRVEEWGDPEAPLCINCAHYRKPHYVYYSACLREVKVTRNPVDGTDVRINEHCPRLQRAFTTQCGPQGRFFKQAANQKPPLKWWQRLLYGPPYARDTGPK